MRLEYRREVPLPYSFAAMDWMTTIYGRKNLVRTMMKPEAQRYQPVDCVACQL
ncbi:MAG: hypothetical protein N4J56_007798 [Chroococcidiopsis sp. SAG 2025]|nr:hypothetical protein [Chroococcidiopsis sp. SAG 2025]